MRLIWVILTILGTTTALPQLQTNADRLRNIVLSNEFDSRNSRFLEDLILGVIEGLRELMLTGSDDIPVLDPLQIDHISVDDSLIPLPGAYVELNNLKVTDLSTFVINSLDVSIAAILLQRYRIELDGEIPVLNANAEHYKLSVDLFGLNIFGEGDAKLQVVQPRLKANILVNLRLTGGIFLNILEMDLAISIKDFRPQINGLFNDQGVSDFISLFLQNLVMELLEFYEVEINELISETVKELANEFLNDFNLADILG